MIQYLIRLPYTFLPALSLLLTACSGEENLDANYQITHERIAHITTPVTEMRLAVNDRPLLEAPVRIQRPQVKNVAECWATATQAMVIHEFGEATCVTENETYVLARHAHSRTIYANGWVIPSRGPKRKLVPQ